MIISKTRSLTLIMAFFISTCIMRQKKKKEPETGSFIQSEKLEAVTNINQTYEAYTISKVAIGDALGRTRILSKRFNNLEMKLVGALLTLSLLTCTVNFSKFLMLCIILCTILSSPVKVAFLSIALKKL